MPELLSPAGDLDKLKTAIRYGADAVYFSGKSFGMRAAAKNFDLSEIREGIEYAHAHGAKAYITVNISPRTHEYEALAEYLTALAAFSPDALMIGDLGVLSVARRTVPDIPIHISTQANVVSAEAALAYAALGAERIVLSRELSLEEIKEIRAKIPEEMEIESFIHVAMCISYSGRCLLSNYLTNRDSNRGACVQACRFEYTISEK